MASRSALILLLLLAVSAAGFHSALAARNKLLQGGLSKPESLDELGGVIGLGGSPGGLGGLGGVPGGLGGLLGLGGHRGVLGGLGGAPGGGLGASLPPLFPSNP